MELDALKMHEYSQYSLTLNYTFKAALERRSGIWP